MEGTLPSSDFPPLVSSPSKQSRVFSKSWNKVFEPSNATANALKFSHFPSEPDIIPFSGEKLSNGGEDWKLCVVGYSIGRRPYYEALLSAVKKTWNLKGSVQLLSLNDGFFLFRFSCAEDFNMVWSRGVWIILGKPFVLQKWHLKFIPKGEEFASVPIWVKIHDLPLACWNSEGISRIASKIGIPVAADSLTEQNTRLTFARICVLVDCSATYSEEIQVSLDGEVENNHKDTGKDISKETNINRGRSTSRRPRLRHNVTSDNVDNLQVTNISNLESINPQNSHSIQESPSLVIGHPLQYQPHSPPPGILKSRNEDIIPEQPPVRDNSLMVCILEIRIHIHSLDDSFFTYAHKLFLNEDSCNNFALSNSGRIWVKWNSSKLTFTPVVTTSQMISGFISVSNQSLFQLSVVYASNCSTDRKSMWNDLTLAGPAENAPWAVIGDFNCCRYATYKLGGAQLSHTVLKDFNECIFLNGLEDLHSVGCNFTWFNQRVDNPIHIKLDRVLVNNCWLNQFPEFFCSIQNPSCSDHCPVILHQGSSFKVFHRFLFKNYWTKVDKYWALLLEVFSRPSSGNPLSHFCLSLRQLKKDIKLECWSSYNSVSKHIEDLNSKQSFLLEQLTLDHSNVELNNAYKSCSIKLV
ncbi:uncharacterized protein LOC114580608 [Dendrobium catenatum]|uniref:uncharacterized protein LOC114580608 n=1 Tax=Dendrobium catenatum TaxID=906689 RepID=UPI00109EE8C1|nr:uncharacterized protein LOC114580608 [Dendrobium catenatum]